MPSGGYGGGGGGATLTPAQREQVFRHQAAVAELLRHFWACFPVLSPQLEEKVGTVWEGFRDLAELAISETINRAWKNVALSHNGSGQDASKIHPHLLLYRCNRWDSACRSIWTVGYLN